MLSVHKAAQLQWLILNGSTSQDRMDFTWSHFCVELQWSREIGDRGSEGGERTERG